MWFAVAALIAWRRSRQWMALLTSLLLLAQGVINMGGTSVAPLYYGTPAWRLVTLSVGMLWMTLFLLVFALFPTGRFVPRWMRWGLVAVPAVLWAYASIVPWSVSTELGLNPLSASLLAGVVAGIIGAQIYRYRRVSTPVERQQTKWILLSLVGFFPPTILYYFLPVAFPALGQPESLYFLWAKSAYSVLWLFIPLCFGIAILRYRLFDIDVIIRLTLVYGTLTALLAAVYVALVVAAHSVVQGLTGEAGEQPAVIVASTLLVIALSTPLRRGVRAAVDRRFYRRKADAERTLVAFGATLGQEVDLERLSAQLVAVVEETMQPEHASLWLRAPDRAARGSHGPP
jgi:hypothetical protein